MSDNKINYFECACGIPDHVIRFMEDIDADHPNLCSNIYLEIQLNTYHPWYKRIWFAIKYVFGFSTKYGHWDCTMLNGDQINKLHAFIHDFYKNVAAATPKQEEAKTEEAKTEEAKTEV